MSKFIFPLFFSLFSISATAAPIEWKQIEQPNFNQYNSSRDSYERGQRQMVEALDELTDTFTDLAENYDRRQKQRDQKKILEDDQGNRYLCNADAVDIRVDPCTSLD